MNDAHSTYINRCFELARRGGKHVKSNPHVGALLVFNNRIIGEGWHQQIGGAHAEVNAVNNVKQEDQHLIEKAILYVSLEPCNRHGRTGPCSEFILKHGIKHVIISQLDPTIGGESLTYLKSKGVEVREGICAKEGRHLIRPFTIGTAQKRPYVILKYAQSQDFFMAKPDEQFWISNAFSKVQAHKWRAQVDGILIGVNTLLVDNPQLNTRLYPGDNPRPIVIDPQLRSNPDSELFNQVNPPIVFTGIDTKSNVLGNAEIIHINFEEDAEQQILNALFADFNICRLLIEGGAKTLKSFIKAGLWDEARIITSQTKIELGIQAPCVQGVMIDHYELDGDKITILHAPG